jgi:uncharacterized protein (DUF952 family)
MTLIYKILPRSEWEDARAAGRFQGSAVDLADGYIHFSTAAQAQETAARHFAGKVGLLVLEVDGDALGAALRWEPSRGGDLFPHLYGDLQVDAVLRVLPAPLDGDGTPRLRLVP